MLCDNATEVKEMLAFVIFNSYLDHSHHLLINEMNGLHLSTTHGALHCTVMNTCTHIGLLLHLLFINMIHFVTQLGYMKKKEITIQSMGYRKCVKARKGTESKKEGKKIYFLLKISYC